MIYPSHYWPGNYWLDRPDDYPYEVFTNSLANAKSKIDNLNIEIKNAKLENRKINILNKFNSKKDIQSVKNIEINKIRPWIQWFSCLWCKDYIPYGRTKFRKQISGIEDSWIKSWWVWNSASNYYLDWYDR